MTPERYQEIDRLCRAALELAPEQRAAYLAAACGADEALRREVESLLAYEAQSGDLLDQPLNGFQSSASLSGRQIGHCRILSLLGRGGMGEVWLAEDTQLGRQVAVKLLPAEFTTQPERVRRFAQEARAASALNHPNIITIHEIGQTENTHYLVTEYIDGETLRQHLTNAPQQRLTAAETLDLALQIAAALAAAHEAGITHRDIKPENVMVRRDGLVKVLDFGLAKLTERAKPALAEAAPEESSTAAGMILGTPRYMSPEQARGERVDSRTDLFSFGAVLYEMSAGRAPFAGKTTSEVLAAILRDEPAPLAPDAPPELASIVHRALSKDRDARYQTAQALLDDLQQLKERLLLKKFSAAPALPEQSAPAKRRRALLLALAAVIVSLAALALWRTFNRPPTLTTQDTILLADFENKTGDEAFDVTLRQGLAIQLQQSPFLRLFPEARARQTLRLMGHAPNQRVTAELAQGICLRENLKALIAGSLAPHGSHYVLTLEARHGPSGEVLARELVEVESKEQVLGALSQAATGLRRKLGESLSSIAHFDRHIEDATTRNPEAFKAYALGFEQAVSGRFGVAIPFYQRAVELDADFAYAWSMLSILHWGTGRSALAAEYAEKAYARRDRASEYEKFRIVFRHHLLVTGDVNKAIETMLMQQRTFANDAVASQDLALAYNLIGQSEPAVAAARESITLQPDAAPRYRELARALLRLNRFAEAKDALAQAAQRKLEMTEAHTFLFQIAFIGNDAAGLREQLAWAHGKPDEYVAFAWQSGAAAFAGQWRKAQEFARRAIELTARGDTQEIAAQYAAEQALWGALCGDCRAARAATAQGLQLARTRATLPRAALALAWCGAAAQAQPLLAELAKRYPEDTLLNSLWLPTIRAALALQRGQAAQALEQLQAATRYEAAAEFWPQYLRGQAYLQLKQSAEAAAEFQKILDHRGYAPLSVRYPLAQLGLAQALASEGDTARSRQAYEAFFAVWKEADPDLPLLRAAQRKAERN